MITIDASAILKVIITENDSGLARAAFSKITEDGEPLLSPDIVFSEVMNGLWKHYALIKDINAKKLEMARSGLNSIYENLGISSQTELGEDALKIATSHKITFYDSLYVALSIRMKAPLLTFDRQLKEKAKEVGFELVNMDRL